MPRLGHADVLQIGKTTQSQLYQGSKSNSTNREGDPVTPEDATVKQTSNLKVSGNSQSKIHQQIEPMKE
jgi:hypothetical protein